MQREDAEVIPEFSDELKWRGKEQPVLRLIVNEGEISPYPWTDEERESDIGRQLYAAAGSNISKVLLRTESAHYMGERIVGHAGEIYAVDEATHISPHTTLPSMNGRLFIDIEDGKSRVFLYIEEEDPEAKNDFSENKAYSLERFVGCYEIVDGRLSNSGLYHIKRYAGEQKIAS